MSETGSAASRALVDRAADWLMAQALKDADLETVVRGACERLHAAGVPIARVHFSFSMLHPLYRAVGYTWRRGQGLTIDAYRHTAGNTPPDRWLRSPY
jgi:adenylate cyclase